MRALLLASVASVGLATAAQAGSLGAGSLPTLSVTSAQLSSATSGLLPKAGGTMTGALTLAKPMTGTTADQMAMIQNEMITGSGTNGPATSQQGLYIDVAKAGWYAGTAQPGQIEGLRINCRNGGGTTAGGSGGNNPTRADVSCETSNAQAPDTSIGFINNAEMVVTLLHRGTNGAADTITQGIDNQIGVIDTSSSRNYGYVTSCLYGTCGNGFLAQATGSGTTWSSVFQGVTNAGVTTSNITGDGAETLAKSVTAPSVVALTALSLAADSTGAVPTLSSSTALAGPVLNSNRTSGNDLTVSGTSGSHFMIGSDGVSVTVRLGDMSQASSTPQICFDGAATSCNVSIVNAAAGRMYLRANGANVFGLEPGQMDVFTPTYDIGVHTFVAVPVFQAGLGAMSGATLTLSGADSSAIASKSAAFTFDATMHTIDASTATSAFAATLPACVTAISGRVYDLVKFDTSTNAATLTAATTNAQTGVADTISGAATVPLTTQWTAATVKCNGAGVWIRGASL